MSGNGPHDRSSIRADPGGGYEARCVCGWRWMLVSELEAHVAAVVHGSQPDLNPAPSTVYRPARV